MAQNDIQRTTLRFTFALTITMMHVFHTQEKAGGSGTAGLANEWNANIWPTWRANHAATIRLDSIYCERIYPTAGDVTLINVSQLGTGAQPASFFPGVTCNVLTWRTAGQGRSGRGRTYLWAEGMNPITGASLVTIDAWRSARVLNIATAIMNRFGPAGASAYTLGVWSRKKGGEPPSDAAGFQPVTSYTLQPYIATMGSRRYGRGM